MRSVILGFGLFAGSSVLVALPQSDASSFSCTSSQGTRKVYVHYEHENKKVPCSVEYTKESEAGKTSQTLWSAKSQEGYCEVKAQEFVETLKGMGWACEAQAELATSQVSEPQTQVQTNEESGDQQPAQETSSQEAAQETSSQEAEPASSTETSAHE